jgi:hypothetical protein
VAAGSSHTSGGPESKASALRPASTMARPCAGRLITVAHEEARLEGLRRGAVAVEVAAIIGVHEDVGAALQFGVDAARRFELEGAGARPSDGRAVNAPRASRSGVRLASVIDK